MNGDFPAVTQMLHGGPLPEDLGYKAWTYNPFGTQVNAFTLTSGTLFATRLYIPKTTFVNGLACRVSGAASDFPFSDDDASLAIVAIISEIESRLAILEKDKVPKITAPTPTIADALK